MLSVLKKGLSGETAVISIGPTKPWIRGISQNKIHAAPDEKKNGRGT